jgi:hypothetical protein
VQGDKYLVSGGAELELFVWQIEEQARSDMHKSGAVDESLSDEFVIFFYICTPFLNLFTAGACEV